MEPQPPKSQLMFCYNPDNPTSMVMLSSTEALIKSIFQPLSINIIWYDPQELGKDVGDIIIELEKFLGVHIQVYHILEQALQDIEEVLANLNTNQEDSKYYFVAADSCRKQITKIIKKRYIKGGVFYRKLNQQVPSRYSQPLQNQALPHEQQQQQEIELQEIEDKKIVYNTPIERLMEVFEIIKRKQTKFKRLPNFVLQASDAWRSNLLTHIILVMVTQKLDSVARRQLVDQMEKFIRGVASQRTVFEEECRLFFNELRKHALSSERAIYWYTKQSPIYHIVNNLLRISHSPTELFYIKPYFEDLFMAIEEKFRKQLPKLINKEIVCYRGGLVSVKELHELKNNVGRVVQNLGFLSTSENEEIAEEHVENAFFVIIVRCRNSNSSHCFGFANISEFSYYSVEAQILFNPLNSFRIQHIQTIHGRMTQKHIITLTYLDFHSLDTSPSSNLTAFEVQLQYIRADQQIFQNISSLQICQGRCFMWREKCLENNSPYWQKFYTINLSLKYKLEALDFLLRQRIKRGQYGSALRLACWILNDGPNHRQGEHVVFEVDSHQSGNQHFHVVKELLSRYQGKQNALVLQQFDQQQKGYSQSYSVEMYKILTLINMGTIFNKMRNPLGIQIFRLAERLLDHLTSSFPNLINYPKSCSNRINSQVAIYKGIANNYNIQNKLEESLKILQQCQQLLINSQQQKTVSYALILQDLACCYKNFGINKTKNKQDQDNMLMNSIDLFYQSNSIIESVYGVEYSCYLRSLKCIAMLHFISNRLEQAVDLLDKCRTISQKVYAHPISDDQYNEVLELELNYAILLKAQQKPQEAMSFLTNSLAQIQTSCIRSDSFPFASRILTLMHEFLVSLHMNFSGPQEILTAIDSCLEVIRRVYGRRSLFIVHKFREYCIFYDTLCVQDSSYCKLLARTVTILSKYQQQAPVEYIFMLMRYGEYCLKSRGVQNSTSHGSHRKFYNGCNYSINRNNEMRENEEGDDAVEIFLRCKKLHEEYVIQKDLLYLQIIEHIIEAYVMCQKFWTAMGYIEIFCQLSGVKSGEHSQQYICSLMKKSTILTLLKNPEEALQVLYKSKTLAIGAFGDVHMLSIMVNLKICQINLQIGNIKEVYVVLDKIIGLIGRNCGKYPKGQVRLAWALLGVCLHAMGRNREALLAVDQVLIFEEEMHGKNSLKYLLTLFKKAEILQALEEDVDCINIYNQICKICSDCKREGRQYESLSSEKCGQFFRKAESKKSQIRIHRNTLLRRPKTKAYMAFK